MYRCKGEIRQILNTIGLMDIHFKVGNTQGFDTAMKIYAGKTQLGILGIPNQDVLNAYDINQKPEICDISKYKHHDGLITNVKYEKRFME